MAKDSTYTGGVIAVMETNLLKDRIFKLCEGSAEEAFKALTDCGFGRLGEALSVYDYERMLAADELEIDSFVREYAPTNAEKAYFLAPRDFHNAKAAVKAEYLGESAQSMFAADGLMEAAQISECVKNRDFAPLYNGLKQAVEESLALFEKDGERVEVTGAQIGIVFDRALFKYLLSACAKNGDLKKLTVMRADMTNILTALRSQTPEYAAENYVYGGILKAEKLNGLFGDSENVKHALDGTPYAAFLKQCFDESGGFPLTAAERAFESAETEYFSKNKYELKRAQPFLYYVFRRKAENANVRILLGCLIAGMPEHEIKKRLRVV